MEPPSMAGPAPEKGGDEFVGLGFDVGLDGCINTVPLVDDDGNCDGALYKDEV